MRASSAARPRGARGRGTGRVIVAIAAECRTEGRIGRVRIERVAWLLGTHQGGMQPHQLDYYLDEFVFRFNRRNSNSRGHLFYRLIQQACQIAPVEGRRIRGGHP